MYILYIQYSTVSGCVCICVAAAMQHRDFNSMPLSNYNNY